MKDKFISDCISLFQKDEIKNNIKILKSSNYYESLSWPDPRKPKFLNIALEISTFLDPFSLLKICKIIEKNLGRKKSFKNSPRKCDIDILDYDNKKTNEQIILPHPRMHKRAFVLIPLFVQTLSRSKARLTVGIFFFSLLN